MLINFSATLCLLLFLMNYFIVVQLQLSAFSPHHSPLLPEPNPPPSLASTLPLGFVHVSFIVVPKNPSPHCPPPSPLAIVRLFLTSVSLVIFCLLFSSVDYVPVKGEIIWYLSLTSWLISLSIMLSSFIHAVALLVGMQTGEATVENNMEFPQKTKNGTAL